MIDPSLIDTANNPRLIFTSQPKIVSDVIEAGEGDVIGQPFTVSHMMTMTLPGLFNCMSPLGFKQVPVTSYMTKGSKIYVFSFVNITPQACNAMRLLVEQKLGKQDYDWLQIWGRAVNLDFLHMPGCEDCSEEGVREMKGMAPYLSGSDDLSIINSLDNQSDPQDVIDFCLNNCAVINFDGAWGIDVDA